MRIKSTAKACLSLFRIRLAEGLQYRAASLSGAFTSAFWALIEITVFTVFYTYGNRQADNAGGMTLSQLVSYVWMGQFVVWLQPMGIDGDIIRKITTGDIGVELCRPLDLYFHWFAKTAAGRLGIFLLRGGFVLLIGILLPHPVGLSPPASAAGFALFLLSMLGAFALCMSYGMLMCAVRIGITWGDGPVNMLMLTCGILSGNYLPLQLWPDALQGLLYWQPFAGTLDLPLRLYVGTMSPDQAGPVLCLQLAWTAVFFLAGRLLLRQKLKSVVVQGG